MGVRTRRGRWLGGVVIAALLIGMMPLVGMSSVAAADSTTVFINEIHYDNNSTDAGEAIEVAAPTGTDLTGWTVVLYNGNGGTVYDTDALGTAVGTCGGYDLYVITYVVNGIQNGAPDGMALVNGTTVVQFLSYEGTFTAADGPAATLTSTDIGVSQPGTGVVGNSLQLSGTGLVYDNFAWQAEAPNTFGACNTGQTFGELDPKINEFVVNHVGMDTNEYVEVYGAANEDYSTLTLLEIGGDGTGAGVIEAVIPVATTNAGGFWVTDYLADEFWNGTVSLLLVDGFTGALSDDLDTNNDGVLDTLPWTELLDDVAVSGGGVDSYAYSTTILTANYDGITFVPGGASRIPDGADTDTTGDWVRNDFDLAGIPTYPGTIIEGEAYNTPGATNVAYTPPPETCGDPFTPIYSVQGNGAASPFVATEVAVEGIVVGDFQNNGSLDNGDLNGFHLQDPTGDTDPLTSDGVFIYYPSGTTDVAVGDAVRVRGTVSEYHGTTQITVSAIWSCSTGNMLPAAAQLSLPVTALTDFEAFEGMRVTFPQTLVISEYYRYDQYNEIVLTSARQSQPSAVYDPGTPEAAALAQANLLDRVTLDDGRTASNPSTVIHPSGDVFTMTNLFRGGDTVANVTGILDQYDAAYRVQPTQGADYTAVNVRPVAPDAVGGDVTVASLNVLNYFTTIDDSGAICGPDANLPCRGADTLEELTRQRAKLVAALAGIDADVVGLIEIENNATDYPTADLVNALNAFVGAGTYDYIATGAIGTDAIRQALIYKPAVVTPVGAFAILDSTVDARFVDTLNRPALAQAFQDKGTGGVFAVAVNHLKSKGSACPDDPVVLDESGMCNVARTAAAEALVDWLATDPTGSGDADALIIGDLNSYDKEDPIDAILAGGYTDLIFHFQGEYAYSYVYDSQIGYLDHALANATLTPQVTGTTIWHINADEPDLIDYDMTYKPLAQELLYAPDAYRSSDHDATIVGLAFAPDTAIAKTVEPATVHVGETVTYTVTLTNTGGISDTVMLTDTLPTDVTFASWVEQPAGAAYDAGEITWTGTVSEAMSVTFRFTAINNALSGMVHNTAEFTGLVNAGSDTASFIVLPEPRIAITKTVSVASALPGDVLTYTIELVNTGGISDTVTLTDTLPTEVVFGAWVDQPTDAVLDQGEITWTGTVSKAQPVVFTFVVTNTASFATVTNTVTFSGTLQTGSASAVFQAGGWKIWLPLVAMNAAP